MMTQTDVLNLTSLTVEEIDSLHRNGKGVSYAFIIEAYNLNLNFTSHTLPSFAAAVTSPGDWTPKGE